MLVRIIVIFFATFFWMIPVEWLSRWWIRNHADALQRARLLLQPDEDLMWKQRSFLRTQFEGHEVQTDKWGFRYALDDSSSADPTNAPILVLGPSSAFGWGVRSSETYPALLATRLGHFLGEKNSVLNAGEIGYSLVQGRKLYDILAKSRSKPVDWVVLAYGINDLDRFRFFGQLGVEDFLYFKSLDSLFWTKSMHSLAFTSLVYRAIQESSFLLNCGLSAMPSVRVPMERFRSELKRFIKRIRADGGKVILVNTPYRDKPTLDLQEMNVVEVLYGKSIEAKSRGECLHALAEISKARKIETQKVAEQVLLVNQIIAHVGREEGVDVIDAYTALDGLDRKDQFVDPVHPSSIGHTRIANLLFDKMIGSIQVNRVGHEN